MEGVKDSSADEERKSPDLMRNSMRPEATLLRGSGIGGNPLSTRSRVSIRGQELRELSLRSA